MSLTTMLSRLFEQPVLTRARIGAAYAVAIGTDVLQFALGPFGWLFVDEALDVVAMFAISRAIGFHVLLLPTFALEFLPITDMLPTWTGCVALVIGMRRRQIARPQTSAPGTVIDV
jgi:hypothetical protein